MMIIIIRSTVLPDNPDPRRPARSRKQQFQSGKFDPQAVLGGGALTKMIMLVMMMMMMMTMIVTMMMTTMMMMILQVKDFASCFLFSLETQHTIGSVLQLL